MRNVNSTKLQLAQNSGWQIGFIFRFRVSTDIKETLFKLNIMSKKLENQEIRIKIEGGRYFLSRYVLNGKVKEQYGPVSLKVLLVRIVSILSGFEPPRHLSRLEKLTD